MSKKTIGKNTKGQITKYFDKFIEKKIIILLKRYFKNKAVIISEELKENIIINKNRKNSPYYIIIDPVDGSDNYTNDIPFVCLGISIFNNNLEPEYSFVGNYYTGIYIYADKKTLKTNDKIDINKNKKSILLFTSTKPNFKNMNKLKYLFNKFDSVRSFGATIGEIMFVCNNKAGAFIDIRGRLTLENFAPFFLMQRHINLIMTDEKGKKIKLKDLSLNKGYKIVITKNKNLHRKIIRIVKNI